MVLVWLLYYKFVGIMICKGDKMEDNKEKAEYLFSKFKDNDVPSYTINVYNEGKKDMCYSILEYLNDVRLKESESGFDRGCYECISELMEMIERNCLNYDEGN